MPKVARVTQLKLVFLALGAAASLIPASIPSISSALAVEVGALTPAVPAMFGGLLSAVMLVPYLEPKVRSGIQMRASLFLIASGVVASGMASSAEVFVLGSFVTGLGFGAAEVIGTSAAKEPGVATSNVLLKLNAAFAMSALTTPIIHIAMSNLIQTNASFWLIGLLVIAVAYAYRERPKMTRSNASLVKLDAGAALFSLAVLCYVGAEALIAGWSSVLVSELGALSYQFAAIGGSAFWALFAIGRIAASVLTPKFIKEQQALLFWPALAATSLLVVSFAWNEVSPTTVFIAFAVAAIAAGPCYALIVGIALDTQRQQNPTAFTSFLILCGAAGGFIFPLVAQAFDRISLLALFGGVGFFAVAVFTILGTKLGSKQTIVLEGS
jgi:hypothetical protein